MVAFPLSLATGDEFAEAKPSCWASSVVVGQMRGTTEKIMQLGAMPLRLCVWLEGSLMFSHTTNPISSWDGCNFNSHLLLQIQTLKINIQESGVLYWAGFWTSFCAVMKVMHKRISLCTNDACVGWEKHSSGQNFWPICPFFVQLLNFLFLSLDTQLSSHCNYSLWWTASANSTGKQSTLRQCKSTETALSQGRY